MSELISKLRINMYKMLLISFISILIWVVGNSILYYDNIVYSFNPILLCIFTCIYIAFIVILYKKIVPKLVKIKYIEYILISIFLLLSVIIGYMLRLNPSWDMGSVYEIAKSHALTGTMGESTYLVSYPNNILIAVIYAIVFKTASFLGITEFIGTATIFNALIVTLTVWITFKIAKILFDAKKALTILFIMLLTTPLYLYVSIYYTDTLSMLFSTLIFYVFLIVNNLEKGKKKLLLEILLGIIIVMAWKIKVTSAFVFIAICVFYILNGLNMKKVKEISNIIISVFIFLLLYNFVIEDRINNRPDVDNLRMPIEYWILTGLSKNGDFKEEYYQFFVKYPTYSEKKEAGRNKIKEELSSFTSNDFVKHLTEKLKFAWTDGTYYAPEKLRRKPVEYNILHEIILPTGKYSSYYKYFPQAMHIGLLIFMIFSSIRILKEKDYKSKNMILLISIFGLIIFLLIWENRSRYILTMLPLYILLGINGVETIEKSWKDRKKLN